MNGGIDHFVFQICLTFPRGMHPSNCILKNNAFRFTSDAIYFPYLQFKSASLEYIVVSKLFTEFLQNMTLDATVDIYL